jgi:excisionase family DNA binding protein
MPDPFATLIDAIADAVAERVLAKLAERLPQQNEAPRPQQAAPLLFSESQAAELLNISVRSLFAERKAGRISFRKSGERILYSREDVEAYIAGIRRVEQPAELKLTGT